MTFDPYSAREALTTEQLMTLTRIIGPLPATVCRLGDVDTKLGRGVLPGTSRCMWTKDGRRITVTIESDGGVIASCSKDQDPTRPVTPV